ncbi:adhesion G protein-coupled receptor F5-like [Heterodontus francisci]|uniref:adhesion G protein-coupled receptor F5-like n=1 Tax=Heterodontus francisci TaxID=7792 RepID=UPI00355B6425
MVPFHASSTVFAACKVVSSTLGIPKEDWSKAKTMEMMFLGIVVYCLLLTLSSSKVEENLYCSTQRSSVPFYSHVVQPHGNKSTTNDKQYVKGFYHADLNLETTDFQTIAEYVKRLVFPAVVNIPGTSTTLTIFNLNIRKECNYIDNKAMCTFWNEDIENYTECCVQSSGAHCSNLPICNCSHTDEIGFCPENVTSLTMKVTATGSFKINESFGDERLNNTSNTSEELKKNLTTMLASSYSNLAGFQCVEILHVRNGSIIVDHKLTVNGELSSKYLLTYIKDAADLIIQSYMVDINSFQMKTEGLVKMEISPLYLYYKKPMNIKCTIKDNVEKVHWFIKAPKDDEAVISKRLYNYTNDGSVSESELEVNATSIWKGYYCCHFDFDNGSIIHEGCGQPKIYLLPEEITTYPSQYTLVKPDWKLVTYVKCCIKDDGENYTVTLEAKYSSDWMNHIGKGNLKDEFIECIQDNFLEQYILVPKREQAIFTVGNSEHNLIEFHNQFEDERCGSTTSALNLNKDNYEGFLVFCFSSMVLETKEIATFNAEEFVLQGDISHDKLNRLKEESLKSESEKAPGKELTILRYTGCLQTLLVAKFTVIPPKNRTNTMVLIKGLTGKCLKIPLVNVYLQDGVSNASILTQNGTKCWSFGINDTFENSTKYRCTFKNLANQNTSGIIDIILVSACATKTSQIATVAAARTKDGTAQRITQRQPNEHVAVYNGRIIHDNATSSPTSSGCAAVCTCAGGLMPSAHAQSGPGKLDRSACAEAMRPPAHVRTAAHPDDVGDDKQQVKTVCNWGGTPSLQTTAASNRGMRANYKFYLQENPEQKNDKFCEHETNEDGVWESTKAGLYAESNHSCEENRVGKIIRLCNKNGQWNKVFKNCTLEELVKLLNLAEELVVGRGAVPQKLPQVLDCLTSSHLISGVDLITADAVAVVQILDALSKAAVNSGSLFNSTVVSLQMQSGKPALKFTCNKKEFVYQHHYYSPARCQLQSQVQLSGQGRGSKISCWDAGQGPKAFLSVASNVTQEKKDGETNNFSSSTLMRSVETFSELFKPPGEEFGVLLSNIELRGKQFDANSSDNYFQNFSGNYSATAEIDSKSLKDMIEAKNIFKISSILYSNIAANLQTKNIIQNKDIQDYFINTLVQSTTLKMDNDTQKTMQPNISITMFFPPKEQKGNLKTAKCVFWNYELFNQEGGWSTEGCESIVAENGTTCICKHLTSFAVLMAPLGRIIPFIEEMTFIGLSISIGSLILFITVEIVVWNTVVKSSITHFRHTALINTAFVLLFAQSFFLIGSIPSVKNNETLCTIATIFTHFFFLSVFFWTLVQSLILLHQLIFVFHHLRKITLMSFSFIIGYVCPLAIVIAATTSFISKGNYLRKSICWLNTEPVGEFTAYYTFIIPVGCIIGINISILIVVIVKLMRPSVSEGINKEDKETIKKVIKAVLILTPTFGLTWIIGFSVDEQSPDFIHYAFVFFNSMQGFFILLTTSFIETKIRDTFVKRVKSMAGMHYLAEAEVGAHKCVPS